MTEAREGVKGALEGMEIQHSQSEAQQEPGSAKFKVVIIGGGPGGLFAAKFLEQKAGATCEVSIFEASERLGGKIITRNFGGVGVYEAGVAEIYDYSRLGPDPLRDMIVNELGLDVKYLQGGPCVLDDKIILTVDDLAKHFGEAARQEVMAFRERCTEMMRPEDYYLSLAEADNAHPWATLYGDRLLREEIRDPAARRYVRTMAHSDVAAPPHHTSGLNFLKNVLMDIDGYMDIFSVVGGNERIVEGLVKTLRANIQVNARARAVTPLPDGTYQIEIDANGLRQTASADFVILALPLTALSTIHWGSETLQIAIDRHLSYFDRPAHYIRVTLLFKRQFWREHFGSDWWMLDAFDGCCVYDESTRHGLGGYGMLAFLIAGNAALALANVPDEQIEGMCLDALPPALAEARNLIVDRRIHRWMASVNAVPGGSPVRRRGICHRPEPRALPGIIMVGDYMFDATLNGVLDSADTGSDIILTEILKRRRAEQQRSAGTIGSERPGLAAAATERALDRYFSAPELSGMLSAAWNLKKPTRILHLGSASGRLVAQLRALNHEVVGLEWDRHAHAATPPEAVAFNLLGEATDLPFEDGSFDIVIETGLCRLPEAAIAKTIDEIRRVARRGVLLGSISLDLPIEIIERYNFLEGLRTFESRWEWAERFYAGGFCQTLLDMPRLEEVWKLAQVAGAGPGHWYEDPESLLFCFYEHREKAQESAGTSGDATQEGAAEESCIALASAA